MEDWEKEMEDFSEYAGWKITVTWGESCEQ